MSMSMSMNTNMGTTVYWHKNQVVIRVKARLTHPKAELSIDKIEDGLVHAFGQLPALRQLHVDLQKIIERPLQLCPPNSDGTVDLVFLHRINTQPHMETMQANGGTAGMSDDDKTIAVINHLNNGKALHHAFRQAISVNNELAIDDVHTIPHWFKAGTDFVTQGCPISPPILVEGASASGQRKLQFSRLPEALQKATGKGVTVFVLDTLPKPDQILTAAGRAGSSNRLLQEMVNGMKCEEPFNAVPPAINFNYRPLRTIVEGTPPERVVTGKDIYGRHTGFRMEDHGLFVAGIVRDLAPEANIECIRVLNDDGVGDIVTLTAAIQYILGRMEKEAEKLGQVVINLSLVVLPPEDNVPAELTGTPILENSQHLLYSLFQCLADQGAILVAAVGNDSDPRMNASEKRFGPRYPAALADSHDITAMIPVGAVNRDQHAALYSNYPGLHGVATYGGDLPKPDPWVASAMNHIVARVDTSSIDALCGVYSATQCPALSKNDPESEYPVPNANAWAYWSGTSFATPIISALAARILEGQDPMSIDVRQAVIDATMEECTKWTGVDGGDIYGPMVIVTQE